MANIYHGKFPVKDVGDDGFAGILPVAQFLPNAYGVYDLADNVWEWCSDWYRPNYYAQPTKTGGVARNPRGPDPSFDPVEPGEKKVLFTGKLASTGSFDGPIKRGKVVLFHLHLPGIRHP